MTVARRRRLSSRNEARRNGCHWWMAVAARRCARRPLIQTRKRPDVPSPNPNPHPNPHPTWSQVIDSISFVGIDQLRSTLSLGPVLGALRPVGRPTPRAASVRYPRRLVAAPSLFAPSRRVHLPSRPPSLAHSRRVPATLDRPRSPSPPLWRPSPQATEATTLARRSLPISTGRRAAAPSSITPLSRPRHNQPTARQASCQSRRDMPPRSSRLASPSAPCMLSGEHAAQPRAPGRCRRLLASRLRGWRQRAGVRPRSCGMARTTPDAAGGSRIRRPRTMPSHKYRVSAKAEARHPLPAAGSLTLHVCEPHSALHTNVLSHLSVINVLYNETLCLASARRLWAWGAGGSASGVG